MQRQRSTLLAPGIFEFPGHYKNEKDNICAVAKKVSLNLESQKYSEKNEIFTIYTINYI